MTCSVDLGDGFFHGAAQIAAADAVLDGDIALVLFPVDLLGAIFHLGLGQLGERNPFAGRRKQTNIFDCLLRIAIRLLVADHQVIARFALQHLADGAPADRGLNGILHVADIDAEASRGLPVDDVVQVGLADHAEDPEVLDSPNLAHDADDLVALCPPTTSGHRRKA